MDLPECIINLPDINLWVFVPIAYLLGSIPFGFVLTQIFTKTDLQNVGSGNIGATNVLRSGHKVLAFFTLLFDALKGYALLIYLFLPVILIDVSHLACGKNHNIIVSEQDVFLDFLPLFSLKILIVGFATILGHCFPVWLKFKGGKGVATTLGVLLTAVPWAGVVACVTWGVVAGFFRISSLSALVAVGVVPIATFLIYGAAPAIVTILIALLVFWRHKENIQRLLKGEEPKIGAKK